MCVVVVVLSATATAIHAQEVVGKRVFSDTLVIAEPFVEDELSAPSFLRTRQPRNGDRPSTWATQFGAELKKRLTPDLEASLTGGIVHLDRGSGPSRTGADNLDIGLKYQFFRSEPQEAVASLALNWEIGGTGRRAVGSENFDTVRPALLAGKGLGGLPEPLSWLRPLALTGSLGMILPTEGTTRTESSGRVDRHPNLVQWGGVIEYSLPYLASFVTHHDLPRPLDRLVPLVEIDMQTAVDRGAAGETRGTINVGAVWIGRAVQIGAEIVAPANERTRLALGARAFIRIGLDELSPRLGRPLFGGSRD